MKKSNRIYIIAEAGVNHNGSVSMAMKLIDVAVDAGADAVKFQTFRADQLVSKTATKAEYQSKTTDDSESQYEMIKKLELDEEAHKILIEHCQTRGIQFLSTPFDDKSVDMLARNFNLPCLKIPSGEITNAPLLLKIAQTGKPVILSTGMSCLGEIEAALGALAFGYLGGDTKPSVKGFQNVYCTIEGQRVLREKVTLLHCTTEYPAPLADVNLRAMDTMKLAFGLPVGFSDHTNGIAVSIAAAASGATIIEKHFTLDRNLHGPDHMASLEPQDLKLMIKSIREVELSLGSGIKHPMMSEVKNMNVARKSIAATREIKEGETFSEDNLTVKRLGGGISPFLYWELIGKKAQKNYFQDETIQA